METLTQMLERLAMTFTVKDIMVPRGELICASDKSSALKRLDEHPEFDVIPVIRKGKISAYLQRQSRQQQRILLDDVISDATSILDLVD
ncbi:MAG: hypothetical protein JRJ12_17265, partial [Deltaproteobacteria bacterium]|nr:hypothetical protein [Deltaproteobacteria bacterium]